MTFETIAACDIFPYDWDEEVKEDKDERPKEFLSCLGNGKGRITEEDEDPELNSLKNNKA